ncbi:MAG: SHOCT domain-containing protein [Chloroflexi bacterium]|nr:MAG: SHOCT domain-containing protein [Chloroflexota bacterium]
MMGGGMIGSGFGLIGGLFGLLFNIAILVGVVVLVVWAVQKFSGSGRQAATQSPGGTNQPLSARDILDMRYARGELTREEYQEKLNDIL